MQGCQHRLGGGETQGTAQVGWVEVRISSGDSNFTSSMKSPPNHVSNPDIPPTVSQYKLWSKASP